MAIDVVLFDYSGVMTSDFTVPTDGVPYDIDALFTEMIGAMMNEREHPWHALERGEITLDAFIADVESRVPHAGAAFAADSPLNVMANLSLRPDRVELVRSLRSSDVRVGLVTNNVAEWAPLWQPALGDDLFEVVIDSSAVGHRKPEAAIYELAVDRFDVTADQALFIDDWTWNVDGAVAAGLHGLHYDGDVELGPAIRERLQAV